MMTDTVREILIDIDRVEADLVRLQSRLWSVRQRLQKATGVKAGFQYDDDPAAASRSGRTAT